MINKINGTIKINEKIDPFSTPNDFYKMSRTTSEEVKLTMPCGERVFNSRAVADKWFSLHKKRCACCKDATRYTSEKKTNFHRKCPVANENELALRKEQIRMNQSLYDVI